ncbi:MAG TPA: hydrogenase maturation protease, partial [Methylocella sp.]|nr:hydrogenase maturation protease [Methylocella sp.]
MQRGARRIILGLGNPLRGDDGAGRLAARLLRPRLPRDTGIVELSGEGAEMLRYLEDAGEAFLIDACASGAPPGTIHRFDADKAPLPHMALSLSSHGFGAGEALGLARALGVLPRRCIVYAIEGRSYALGAPLSAQVLVAVHKVAERLASEIGREALEPVF